MRTLRRTVPLCLGVWQGMVVAIAFAQSPDGLSRESSWRPATVDEVKAQALAWLDQKQADQAVRDRANEIWSSPAESATGDQLLDRLAETVALVDPKAAELKELCRQPRRAVRLPEMAWLSDAQTPPLVSKNLRLYYGRWLVQEELYDEALQQLEGVEPKEVVAPAALLFYRGVAQHTLLQKEEGLRTIAALLRGAEHSPKRYVAMARLMEQDLEKLENDTLDHIARRMGDIERRLGNGRAGEQVQKVQRGVIESLDKLIKRLEEQQQQSGGGGGQDSIRSSSPAPDSIPIGGKGPGNVEKRPIGAESGWGDLPPKEREEALQQVGRDFPSHYRDIIEQYFRRLAGEENR